MPFLPTILLRTPLERYRYVPQQMDYRGRGPSMATEARRQAASSAGRGQMNAERMYDKMMAERTPELVRDRVLDGQIPSGMIGKEGMYGSYGEEVGQSGGGKSSAGARSGASRSRDSQGGGRFQ